MCEQTPIHYKNGDVVWVRLEKSAWWPAEVVDPQDLPNDIKETLNKPGRKPPLVIVTFFQEKSYEFIKNLSEIYSYNCSKKDEFIKKGMDRHRKKTTFMKQFPEDVRLAEQKTGGDVNILEDPKFLPEVIPKIDYVAIFGSGSKKKETPKRRSRKSLTSKSASPQKRTPTSQSRTVTHRRFLGHDSDHQVRVLLQSSEQAAEPDHMYDCQMCGFSSTRIDVIVLHNKSHMQGTYTPVTTGNKVKRAPVRKAAKKTRRTPFSKTSTIAEDLALLAQGLPLMSTSDEEEDFDDDDEYDFDEEEEEEPIKKPKRRKRLSEKPKVKKPKVEEPVEVKKKDIRVDLLAEWDDDEDDEQEQDTTLNLTASSADCTLDSNVTKKDEDKSCFDFKEEDDNQIISTTPGRKIPRLIPTKRKSTEPCEDANLPTAENDANRAEQNKNSEHEASLVEVEAFQEILEATATPIIPELPQSLKSEQNFPNTKAIKFPDKSLEPVTPEVPKPDTPTKLINIKKRFVKSFEDFEQSLKIEKAKEESEKKQQELQNLESEEYLKPGEISELPQDSLTDCSTNKKVDIASKIDEFASKDENLNINKDCTIDLHSTEPLTDTLHTTHTDVVNNQATPALIETLIEPPIHVEPVLEPPIVKTIIQSAIVGTLTQPTIIETPIEPSTPTTPIQPQIAEKDKVQSPHLDLALEKKPEESACIEMDIEVPIHTQKLIETPQIEDYKTDNSYTISKFKEFKTKRRSRSRLLSEDTCKDTLKLGEKKPAGDLKIVSQDAPESKKADDQSCSTIEDACVKGNEKKVMDEYKSPGKVVLKLDDMKTHEEQKPRTRGMDAFIFEGKKAEVHKPRTRSRDAPVVDDKKTEEEYKHKTRARDVPVLEDRKPEEGHKPSTSVKNVPIFKDIPITEEHKPSTSVKNVPTFKDAPTMEEHKPKTRVTETPTLEDNEPLEERITRTRGRDVLTSDAKKAEDEHKPRTRSRDSLALDKKVQEEHKPLTRVRDVPSPDDKNTEEERKPITRGRDVPSPGDKNTEEERKPRTRSRDAPTLDDKKVVEEHKHKTKGKDTTLEVKKVNEEYKPRTSVKDTLTCKDTETEKQHTTGIKPRDLPMIEDKVEEECKPKTSVKDEPMLQVDKPEEERKPKTRVKDLPIFDDKIEEYKPKTRVKDLPMVQERKPEKEHRARTRFSDVPIFDDKKLDEEHKPKSRVTEVLRVEVRSEQEHKPRIGIKEMPGFESSKPDEKHKPKLKVVDLPIAQETKREEEHKLRSRAKDVPILEDIKADDEHRQRTGAKDVPTIKDKKSEEERKPSTRVKDVPMLPEYKPEEEYKPRLKVKATFEDKTPDEEPKPKSRAKDLFRLDDWSEDESSMNTDIPTVEPKKPEDDKLKTEIKDAPILESGALKSKAVEREDPRRKEKIMELTRVEGKKVDDDHKFRSKSKDSSRFDGRMAEDDKVPEFKDRDSITTTKIDEEYKPQDKVKDYVRPESRKSEHKMKSKTKDIQRLEDKLTEEEDKPRTKLKDTFRFESKKTDEEESRSQVRAKDFGRPDRKRDEEHKRTRARDEFEFEREDYRPKSKARSMLRQDGRKGDEDEHRSKFRSRDFLRHEERKVDSEEPRHRSKAVGSPEKTKSWKSTRYSDYHMKKSRSYRRDYTRESRHKSDEADNILGSDRLSTVESENYKHTEPPKHDTVEVCKLKSQLMGKLKESEKSEAYLKTRRDSPNADDKHSSYRKYSKGKSHSSSSKRPTRLTLHSQEIVIEKSVDKVEVSIHKEETETKHEQVVENKPDTNKSHEIKEDKDDAVVQNQIEVDAPKVDTDSPQDLPVVVEPDKNNVLMGLTSEPVIESPATVTSEITVFGETAEGELKPEDAACFPHFVESNEEASALATLATVSEMSSFDRIPSKCDLKIDNLTVVSESDLGDGQVEIAKIPIMEEGTIKATTVASFSVDFTDILDNKSVATEMEVTPSPIINEHIVEGPIESSHVEDVQSVDNAPKVVDKSALVDDKSDKLELTVEEKIELISEETKTPTVESIKPPVVESINLPVMENTQSQVTEKIKSPVVEKFKLPTVEVIPSTTALIEPHIVTTIESPENIDPPIEENVDPPIVEKIEATIIEKIDPPIVEKIDPPIVEKIEEELPNSLEMEMAKLTDTSIETMIVEQPQESTTSTKLLEILTDNKIPKKASIPTNPLKISNPKFELDSGDQPVSKPKSKLLIKSVPSTSKMSNKSFIHAEKVMKPAAMMVSVQKVSSKQEEDLNDFESMDTYIIKKPGKRGAGPGDGNPEAPKLPKKSLVSKSKPTILGHTIIKPGGEVIQPVITPTKVQSDENVFDIDSMPIVLTDQILTPESLEKMPIVIQQEAAQPTKQITQIKKLPQPQIKLLNKSPPVIMKESTFRQAGKVLPKHLKHQKVYQQASTVMKSNPGLITQATKQGKFVIVPSESPSSSTTSKYTVGKRHIMKKSPAIIAGSSSAKTQNMQEPTGNKIMIVTNNQGQQSRVVLTPAQQKMIGYQTSMKKGTIKTMVQRDNTKSPNILSQTIINPKGQITTTNQAMYTSTSPLTQIKKPRIDPSKNKLLGQKLILQSSLNQIKHTPGQPRTIIIKNPQGQTVKRIQGTDDALLEQQVAEQLEAINKATATSWSQNSYKAHAKRYSAKKPLSESTKLALQTKTQMVLSSSPSTSNKSGNVPPLAPISPAKKMEVQTTTKLIPKSSSTPTQTQSDKAAEKDDSKRAPHQLVIQDAMGNQTTISEGQILALPSETVDGQPQSYMLVTLDETGNLTPLNNEALMSLDPSLNLGGDLNNMVLQIDQGTVNTEGQAQESAVEEVKVKEPVVEQPEVVVPVVEEAVPEVVADKVVPEVEAQPAVDPNAMQAVACAINNGETNQQLIITGDPISTQKFLESLTEGNADLANLLANAEGNILIHADGQQILINTDSDNQMLLMNSDAANTMESGEGSGNPIFSSQAPKNQDILAAALADTDVFQQEQSIVPSSSKTTQSQLSPGNALYPMNVNNVLETSAMSSPIMTPLEIPSTNAKKVDDTDILSQIPKNVDLPITITDPNIAHTVANQQAALMSSELHTNLELPLGMQDVAVTSAGMNSPSFSYSLPALDDSVDIQKPFTSSISMPLLTEEPEDAVTTSSVTVSATLPSDIIETTIVDNTATSTASETTESEKPAVPAEDVASKTESEKEHYMLATTGMCTMNNQLCSSLSEPPPDMFDFTIDQSYDIKQSTESDMDYIPEENDVEKKVEEAVPASEANSSNTNSTDSCEIPVQPDIVTDISMKTPEPESPKRGAEDAAENDSKKCKFD